MRFMTTIVFFTALGLQAFAEDQLPSATVSPWTNESQVSVVQTSGNSTSESYSVKQASSYTKEKYTLKVSADALRASADNVTTKKNEDTADSWSAGLRLEKAISEKWGGFLGQQIESDRFAGFRQRHNTDVGGKYLISKSDAFETLGEFGYRYTQQNNIDNTHDHASKLRIYLEGIYKFNPTNSAKLWAEYLPNLDESTAYLVNYEASLSSSLNSIFSLKIAHLTKTINKPAPGKEKSDNTLTAALVAKF